MAGYVSSITQKSQDISGWYNDVIQRAKLAEHGPVKGTMIWRPSGFRLWQEIQSRLNPEIEKIGAQNVYFPLLIPQKFLEKEKTHIKGFSPEVAVVTRGGGEKLTEPVVIRPTSETIMYDAFSRWIQSFRDLPLILNQWANIVRWEKRPYFFLRTTEFLWQEGHSAHQSLQEAQVMVDQALKMYAEFYQQVLAIYGIAGRKSESEKFPGADATYTYEILSPDGKVIQGCTSHNLGQNFSKSFKVLFSNPEGKREFVYQTSWGFSSRSIGAMILVHGDDNGLVIPPTVAPIQTVVIPIVTQKGDNQKITRLAGKAFEILKLNNVRVKLDDSDASPGWKFNQYELEGVPLRVEVGAAEAREEKVKIIRRDNKQSFEIPIELIGVEVNQLFGMIAENLWQKSKKFTEENTRQADTYRQFKEIMNTTKGFIEAYWCEDPSCEQKIKEETKATTRCLPNHAVESQGECIYCTKLARFRWIFGQSY